MITHLPVACLIMVVLPGSLPTPSDEPTPARYWVSRSSLNSLPLAWNVDRTPEDDLLTSTPLEEGESPTLYFWAPPRDAAGNCLTLRYLSLNLVGSSGRVDSNDDFEIENPASTIGTVNTSRFESTLDSLAPDSVPGLHC